MIEIFVHVVFTFCLGMQASSVRKLLVHNRLFCLCCAQLLYRNVCFLKLLRYYKYWIVGSDIILSSGYLCCTGWEKHFHWIQWNLKVNSSVFGCNEWATSLLRLMYFGSEPQTCIALGAILDICTHICYIYEKLCIFLY